jgi:cytochrome P450
VPFDIKQAVAADVLPDGTRVNRGDRVVYVPYAMGRLAELWDDPAEFRPERFLDDGGAFKFPPAATFPVFQAGPRTCLGKDVAYLGASVVLDRLLDAFDVALAPSARAASLLFRPPSRAAPRRGQGEPVYDTGLTLWVVDGLRVVFSPRGD